MSPPTKLFNTEIYHTKIFFAIYGILISTLPCKHFSSKSIIVMDIVFLLYTFQAMSLLTGLETGSGATSTTTDSNSATYTDAGNDCEQLSSPQEQPPMTPPTLALAPPPPPPPPPKLLKSSQFMEAETLHWLMKQLQTSGTHSTTNQIE